MYDRIFIFANAGFFFFLQPSDRLQSESEVAEKEAKRLRELEEERLRRMTGEAGPESNKASNKSQNHRSADDLDDG